MHTSFADLFARSLALTSVDFVLLIMSNIYERDIAKQNECVRSTRYFFMLERLVLVFEFNAIE